MVVEHRARPGRRDDTHLELRLFALQQRQSRGGDDGIADVPSNRQQDTSNIAGGQRSSRSASDDRIENRVASAQINRPYRVLDQITARQRRAWLLLHPTHRHEASFGADAPAPSADVSPATNEK